MKKPLYIQARMKKLCKNQKLDLETLRWIKEKSKINKISVQHFKKDFIPLDKEKFKIFLPQKNWFYKKEFISNIHGMGHTLRVILNSYIICQLKEYKNYYPILIAASIHDIRRKSDKEDPNHGKRAFMWFKKKNLAIKKQLEPLEIEGISMAIVYHNVPYNKIPKQKLLKFRKYIDILKYADAMDRFRLPKQKWWPSEQYLKLNLDKKIFDLSKYLFYETERLVLEKEFSTKNAIILVGLKMKVLKG